MCASIENCDLLSAISVRAASLIAARRGVFDFLGARARNGLDILFDVD